MPAWGSLILSITRFFGRLCQSYDKSWYDCYLEKYHSSAPYGDE